MKAAVDEIRKDNLEDEYTEEAVVNVDISADGSRLLHSLCHRRFNLPLNAHALIM